MLTKQQQKMLLKVAKKNNNSISAQEYKKIVSPKSENKKPLKQKSMTASEYRALQSKNKSSAKKEFSFALEFEEVVPLKEYRFVLHGRHLSTNSMDSLSFKARLRYKNAIKQAFYDFAICNKKRLLKSPIDGKVEIFPTAWIKSRIPRDDDGYRTIKTIRDMIVQLGFVVDDSPNYMIQHRTKEHLSNCWKIEIFVKQIS
jgi:hypothetical protein